MWICGLRHRDGVIYPREVRLVNICRLALEAIMLQRQTRLQFLSNSKILQYERRTSL